MAYMLSLLTGQFLEECGGNIENSQDTINNIHNYHGAIIKSMECVLGQNVRNELNNIQTYTWMLD